MTYEEKIKDAIGCIKRHRRGLSDYNGDWSFFDTAIEALEKQIPKKSTKDGYMNFCPRCESEEIEIDIESAFEPVKFDFCPRCGQAIDWSDT